MILSLGPIVRRYLTWCILHAEEFYATAYPIAFSRNRRGPSLVHPHRQKKCCELSGLSPRSRSEARHQSKYVSIAFFVVRCGCKNREENSQPRCQYKKAPTNYWKTPPNSTTYDPSAPNVPFKQHVSLFIIDVLRCNGDGGLNAGGFRTLKAQ